MARARSNNQKTNSSANIGSEAKLCLAADNLRSYIDAAEYKHVVLAPIFRKYISDNLEELRDWLQCIRLRLREVSHSAAWTE